MDFLKYITENALILIPVLYIIGLILKGTEKIKDNYIPIILLPLGIIASVAVLGLNAQAIIQGILVTGVTVYGDQLIKQRKKDN